MQQNTLGTIAYEITNYLGNVNVVISDRKIWTGTPTSAFKACTLSRTDYFPFGMEISSRTTVGTYRFGYNGMEQDPEAKGEGNSYTTEFRQYDPRIGRWLSLDPLMAQFPWQSPYCAFDNNPVINVDPLGLYSEKGANRKADRMERKGYENVSVVQSRDKDGNKTGNYGVSTTGKKDGSGYGHYFGSNVKKSSSSGQTNNVMADAFSQVAAKSKSVNYLPPLPYGSFGNHYPPMASGSCSSTSFAQPFIEIGQELIAGGLEMVGMNSEYSQYTAGGLMFFGTLATGRIKSGSFVTTKKFPTGAQYSVAFETKLASNLYPGGSYRAHFQAANTSLSNVMASDMVFANSMSKLGITIPRSSTGNILGKSPSNWVWHHDINTGVMQLVPKIQHPSIRGGIFWNTMHPGGRGGMSIWNK